MDSYAYFMDKNCFEIKDIIQIQNYQINLDEETNAKTIITLVKTPNIKDGDIVVVKEGKETKFVGVAEAPECEENSCIYTVSAKYITNLFDRKIILDNEVLIKEQGIEDFIEYTLKKEFINNEDTLLNFNYIDIEVLTHTIKKFTPKTENGIYNFHTFINNCTQNYNIIYIFKFENSRLKIIIENIENEEVSIVDTNVSDIQNYIEKKQTNVVSKVTVLCENNTKHSYFLLSDRTTTEDINDENRAVGDIQVIYEKEQEDAKQAALNIFRSNSYSHLIQFDINKNTELFEVKKWKIGTLLKIKNRENEVIDTYVSAITIKKDNPIYTIKTGKIRIDFLDRLKQKEREVQ